MAKDKPKAKGAGQKPGDARGRRIQTEEKAKGLIGLKKGEKVKDAPYSVGNYKGRTLNLTGKQLAKAGGAAAKKAAKNTVKIQDTKFEKGKGVTDSSGKALNGRVDLGGGNFAVYVDGKRVRAAKKATPARGGGSGGAGGGGSKSAVQKAKDKMGKGAGYGKGAGTPSNLTGNSGGAGGAARPKTAREMAAENRRRAQQRRGTNAMYNNGTRVSMSSASPAKEGQRRTRVVNGRKVVEKYSGGKWLPLTGSRGGY